MDTSPSKNFVNKIMKGKKTDAKSSNKQSKFAATLAKIRATQGK